MKSYLLLTYLLCCFTYGFARQAVREDGVLKLMDAKGRYLLGYQYEVLSPPPGVDAAFKRAGFIHPLNTLSGKTLTRIQPSDHYHHFGLWNPWTRIAYKGKVYDLWNIGDKQGTIRSQGVEEIKSKGKTIGFKAKHAHIIFPQSEKEVQILDESWEAHISPIDDKRYSCDLTSTLQVVGQDTVVLKAYRYAGLGFRANEQWTNKNSKIITSEGNDRKTADGSLARWVIAEGDLDGSSAGLLFLSSPENYNHPEPIRVWPEQENKGRGDVFVNFSPTKNKDWVLVPGKKYILRYRLIVFDGEMEPTEAEKFWEKFTGQ
ncbi:MAG: PmoA family protein [Olivibacter sp.]|nr:PmoA family protein [Olivibacter sp. UJ_SKK_5.1]